MCPWISSIAHYSFLSILKVDNCDLKFEYTLFELWYDYSDSLKYFLFFYFIPISRNSIIYLFQIMHFTDLLITNSNFLRHFNHKQMQYIYLNKSILYILRHVWFLWYLPPFPHPDSCSYPESTTPSPRSLQNSREFSCISGSPSDWNQSDKCVRNPYHPDTTLNN